MIDHVHALPEGYRLQEYTITGTLGFGGFGITYSALDNNLDKVVAIKEYLPGELAARVAGNTVSVKSEQDRESFDWGLDAFLNEAKTVAKFDHPNVVRIHRFFEQNGTGYIVMEFIEGRTLSSVLKEQGTLEESEIRAWLWPVMDGLKIVHKAGYLHRDIKPPNIMKRKDGRPCVLDFGAARMAMGGMTRSLTAIMTPGFAPLEQYETRGNQGPWTDIYALGAVMYGCIAGHKPKDALDRIRNDALETPDSSSEKTYSKALLRGIAAALSMQEEDRPQDITALLMILDAPEEPTLAMPEKPKAQPSVAATRRIPERPESTTHRLTTTPLPPLYADVDVVREKPEISESKGIGKWLAIAILPILIGAFGVYWWMGYQEVDPVTQTTNGTAQRESKPAVQKPQSVPPQKPENQITKTQVQQEPESLVQKPQSKPVRQRVTAYEGINVRSDPSGANIFIDGKYIGFTPVNIQSVKAGRTTAVRLEFEGYEPIEQVVTTPMTGSRDVTLTLTKIQSVSDQYKIARKYHEDGDAKKALNEREQASNEHSNASPFEGTWMSISQDEQRSGGQMNGKYVIEVEEDRITGTWQSTAEHKNTVVLSGQIKGDVAKVKLVYKGYIDPKFTMTLIDKTTIQIKGFMGIHKLLIYKQ